MLSRHFLRGKTLQAIYANTLSESADISGAKELFKQSIYSINELGIRQLSLLVEFPFIAERMIEEGMRKFNPTESERNPNMRFVNNEFLRRLTDNINFKKEIKRYNINWTDQSDKLRKLFITFSQSALFADYLSKENSSYDDDRTIALELFRFIMNDEVLHHTITEEHVDWIDDYDQIAQYNFMMIKTLDEQTFNEASTIPLMQDKTQEKDNTDLNFALLLFEQTMRTMSQNEPLIKKYLQNWDFERVAVMDILIINMAIVEFTQCETIPEKVTINEYVELAKEFSTDKSKIFVNGILDKLLSALRSAGRVEKSGEGLDDGDWLFDESH